MIRYYIKVFAQADGSYKIAQANRQAMNVLSESQDEIYEVKGETIAAFPTGLLPVDEKDKWLKWLGESVRPAGSFEKVERPSESLFTDPD